MSETGSNPPAVRGALPLLGLACAVGVGTIYYNQPLLLLMGRSFHADDHAMGFVATATQLGYAAGLLTIVPLGDIRDRRGLMQKLYAAVGISLAVAGLTQTLSQMLIMSIVMGVLASVTHIALPMAPDLVGPEKRGQAIGTVMTGLLLGVLLARTFAGWLSKLGSWRVVYFAAAAMSLAFVPIISRMMPKLAPKQAIPYGELLKSLFTIFRREPLLRESAAMGALTFASFSCFWTTIAFMLHDHFGLGAGVAGSFGVVGAAGAMLAPIAGKLSDKHGTRYVVGLAGAIFSAAVIMLWLAVKLPLPVWGAMVALVAAVVVLDAGMQMLQVGNQTRIFSLGAAERSRFNTVYMTLYFLGGAVGSAAATVVWGKWGWNGVCALQLGFIGLAGLRHLTGHSRTLARTPVQLSAEDREMMEM